MKASKTEKLQAIARALDVLSTLRKQCPWDREQTPQSLRANTIEEVFELSEAILSGDAYQESKELGDVLLHVLFYCDLAEERGDFDIADVCNRLCDKLIYRHPHIYGDRDARTAQEVEKNWERIKQKEKDGNKRVLSGVPRSLPSMVKAYRIQDKARAVGFDWQNREEVWNKVKEEIGEVEAELCKDPMLDSERKEEEIGDLLFSLINAARLYGVNPDNALEKTCHKFIHRFEYIEDEARKMNRPIADLSLEEMDHLWEEAKKNPIA